jgi:hypothetical protein
MKRIHQRGSRQAGWEKRRGGGNNKELHTEGQQDPEGEQKTYAEEDGIEQLLELVQLVLERLRRVLRCMREQRGMREHAETMRGSNRAKQAAASNGIAADDTRTHE